MQTRYIVSGVVERGDEIILGKKAKGQPPYPDVWHTPGGGADDQVRAKELFDAGNIDDPFWHEELRREIREELGVEIANIRNIVPEFRAAVREGESLNKSGEPTHYYFLEFLCDYAGGDLHAADDLAEAKWVHKDELKNMSLTPPSLEMYKELGWL